MNTQTRIPGLIRNRIFAGINSEQSQDRRQAEIHAALISRENVTIGTETHNYDDVLNHLWENVDDSEQITLAMFGLITAKSTDERDLLVNKITTILNRGAAEYTSEIMPDVTAQDLADEMSRAADYLAEQRSNDRDYHHL